MKEKMTYRLPGSLYRATMCLSLRSKYTRWVVCNLFEDCHNFNISGETGQFQEIGIIQASGLEVN